MDCQILIQESTRTSVFRRTGILHLIYLHLSYSVYSMLSTGTRKQSKVSNGGVVTGQDYGNGGVVTGQDYGNGGVVTGQDYGVDFKGSVVTLNSVHSGKDDLSHFGSVSQTFCTVLLFL